MTKDESSSTAHRSSQAAAAGSLMATTSAQVGRQSLDSVGLADCSLFAVGELALLSRKRADHVSW